MKYENELSVQETLQNMKVELCMWIPKTSTHMLVKNYKRTKNIVHVNQRMKYENVLSVQETNKYSS